MIPAGYFEQAFQSSLKHWQRKHPKPNAVMPRTVWYKIMPELLKGWRTQKQLSEYAHCDNTSISWELRMHKAACERRTIRGGGGPHWHYEYRLKA